jgi:hypothetical protein
MEESFFLCSRNERRPGNFQAVALFVNAGPRPRRAGQWLRWGHCSCSPPPSVDRMHEGVDKVLAGLLCLVC